MKQHPLNKSVKILLAAVLLLFAGLVPGTASAKKIYIQKGGDNGSYIHSSFFAYSPGDTLVLRASLNSWNYFSMGEIHGTASAPVVIINEGGQVQMQSGFNLANCTFIKITGADRYGFLIEHSGGGGVAIDLNGKTSDIEVTNVHIRNKQYGFWIKNEAHCDPAVNNWVIKNISLHDITIQNVSQEGFYIGSTAPNGGRPVFCNGGNLYPIPSRVGNIRVYNNVIDNTGRAGIQLSSANYGDNEIYGNTVTNCGYEFDPAQGNGIVLGGYTHAYVHDNTIRNTFASGIFSLGSGPIRIENNRIENSGSLYGRTANGMANIMMDTRPTTPLENTQFSIRNNQMGANTHNNITVYGSTFTPTGNIICNNTSLIGGTITQIVTPGITWSGCGTNQLPIVNAGPDQAFTLPLVSVQLHGAASDPDGYLATYKWTKVSGPDVFLLSNSAIATPVLTGLIAGTYTFRLTVTDNSGGVSTDDVVITINASPINSSSSIKIEAENWAIMKGVGTEPTIDAGGGLSVGWIDNTDWMDYSVNIPQAGTYTVGFRVATMATSAELQVRNASGGLLATVPIPNTTGWQSWQTVVGTMNLPAGQQTIRIVSTKPDAWNFNYFELAAGGTAPANQLPSANAGTDQTITLPTSSVQLGGSGSDPDGSIASYAWSKVSGPAAGTFNSTTGTNPIFSGLVQGTYTLRLTVTDNAGATATDDVVITVNPAASTPPPSGSGLRIQAENWTAMKGVGTEPTQDAGGGLSVGWIDNTDWMDYSVNLTQAGNYTVTFRVASPATSGQLKLLNAAGTTLATVNVPNTTGWQTWQTATATVTLPAGQQSLRILSTSADAWNFNWFELTAGGTGGTPNQAPVVNAGADQTITLPTSSVQLNATATDADGSIATYSWSKVSGPAAGSFSSATIANPSFGGMAQGTYTLKLTVTDNAGATASDEIVITVNPATSTTPAGPAVRIQAENWTIMKGVGTEGTTDEGGGLSVGWIDNTDWMDYSVNLTQAGTYTVNFRVATPATSGQLKLLNAAGTTLATVNVPNTGWWQTWQTATATVTLPAGQQTLRVLSSSADAWNFNWFELASGSGGGTPTNQLPTVTAGIDQTITLPTNSVQLGGSATDPDGNIASYSWSKVSGPAEGTFNSTTGTNPTFSGLVQGTYTLRLTVTDNAGATASDEVVITVNPATTTPPTGPAIRIQAESWTAMSGVGTEGTSDAGGGLSVGWIDNNDWMDYSVNLTQAGTYTVSFRVASPATSAQVQLRSSNGTVLATVSVPNTGGWQTWQTVSATVTLPAGQQTLRVVSSHPDAWNFNWFELAGSATVSTRGLGEATEVVEDGGSIEAVEVFPNPVSDRFVLKVSSPLTGAMQVQVVDMNGSVTKQFNLQKLSAGTSQSYLSVQGLAKGEYILRVQMGQWTKTVKLVKL